MIFRQPEREKSLMSTLCGIGVYILLFAFVLLASLFCVRAFAGSYRYYPINGTSMQPILNPTPDSSGNQDGVFVKVTKNVSYGDIVIIEERPQFNREKNEWITPTIVKRVIAQDGDAITIMVDDFSSQKDNLFHTFLLKSGSDQVERLDESYVDQTVLENWTAGIPKSNRQPHEDDTSFETSFKYEGLIYANFLKQYTSSTSPLGGKTVLHTITYTDQSGREVEVQALFYQLGEDEIFYMGDNRSESSDARDVANRTTIKREKVVGKVVKIVHNAASFKSKGLLWCAKLGSLLGYFWDNLVDFFAW